MDQKPSVGRIVHFHHAASDGSGAVTLAAIVVKVFTDDCVNLQVLNDGYTQLDTQGSGVVLRTSVARGDGPYQWSWPPRV
jgi:hypothetical protein